MARHHQLKIRTVVLYHSGVKTAPDALDIGTAQYHVENIYLSELNGDSALDEVTRHLQTDQWHPEDRLRLALAMSMDLHDRDHAFERVLALVPNVPDEAERNLVVAALLALGEHGLSDAQRERLRKELRQVSKIAQELVEEGREEGRQEGREEGREEVAKAMLLDGDSIDRVVKLTKLTREEVEELRKQIH